MEKSVFIQPECRVYYVELKSVINNSNRQNIIDSMELEDELSFE